jgi:hypothetical protein
MNAILPANHSIIDVDCGGMPDPAVREEIFEIERKMQEAIDDAQITEVDVEEWVNHILAPGVYAREMTIKKHQIIVGKIHKTSHINIISKGDISVKTQFGVWRYQAPCSFVSEVGTKRVVFAHEDTVWTTIHPTEETELDKIEEHVIAKSYDEIPAIDGPPKPKCIEGEKL